MTQTIRTSNGHNSVWIEADYGQGRRGKPRLVTWGCLKLVDFIETFRGQELDENLIEEIKKFDRGFAFEAIDGSESKIFRTKKEARDWAWSQCC